MRRKVTMMITMIVLMMVMITFFRFSKRAAALKMRRMRSARKTEIPPPSPGRNISAMLSSTIVPSKMLKLSLM